jgi:3-oxoacyl-[acyl-carrier protein] reductase
MDLGLQNLVVLVTGGSGAIGRATARLFAAEGARVAVTYHRRQHAAEDLVNEIVATGGDALAIPFHLESELSIRQSIESVRNRWNRLDVLINNAFATTIDDRGGETLRGSLERLLHCNTIGPYQAIEMASPLMRENRFGRIVNVSSALAVDGMQRMAWYTAAKSALHGMTISHAKDLGPFGILVNVVMPGFTATDSQPIEVSPIHRQKAASSLPIRRLPTPEEVAVPIAFLASPANRIITGEAIRVSGGRP